LNNFNNRSVTPNASEFTFYNLDIKVGSTSITGYPKQEITLTAVETPIILDPGTYIIEVTGLTGVASSTIAVATHTPVSATVAPAKTTPVKVILGPKTGSGEAGTFRYNITTDVVTSDIDSATIQLGSSTPINLLTPYKMDNSNQDTTGVTAGDYNLEVVIKLKGTLGQVTFKDVVYIYDGLTSTFAFNAKKEYFNGGLNIIVTYDEAPILSDNAGTNTLNTSTEYTGLAQGSSVTITVTNDTDFSTITWYENNSSLGTGASMVLNATTSTDRFFAKKLYRVTVEGVSATNSNTYTTYLDIMVQ